MTHFSHCDRTSSDNIDFKKTLSQLVFNANQQCHLILDLTRILSKHEEGWMNVIYEQTKCNDASLWGFDPTYIEEAKNMRVWDGKFDVEFEGFLCTLEKRSWQFVHLISAWRTFFAANMGLFRMFKDVCFTFLRMGIGNKYLKFCCSLAYSDDI